MYIFIFMTVNIYAQSSVSSQVRIVNFSQLEPRLHEQNDTLYLVNFWATWCGPCREEIPAILNIGQKYASSKFKILFVSLDMPKQIKSHLIPFITKNKMDQEVVLLDDPDQNKWIDKVDPKWSGDIPFTLIYKKDSRESYARSFQFAQLDSIINNKLQKP